MRSLFYFLLLTIGSVFVNDAYAYEHEVWRSGSRYYWKTFDVERGSSTSLKTAIEGAMGSGNRDIHILTGGTLDGTINVSATGVRLYCHNNTFTCGFTGTGISNSRDGFEIHDLTIRNVIGGYGIRSSGASDMRFINVKAIDIDWIGIRIDSRSSNPWNYTIYNLYMKDCYVENTGSHGIEIYSIDGVTFEGTMTARNTGGCGVLLNQSRNGTIETVDAYNCDWGGGYAGLRFANGCNNITAETLYADRCGRGFFIVQSGPSSNIHLNYAEIRECSNIGIWIENGTNCSVKAGCSNSGVSVSGSGSYANVSSSCSTSGGGGGASYYQLRNRGTGLYLDGMGRTTNGDAAGQWANTSHANSQWEMVSNGSYYQLRNRGTGLFLDGMGRTTNGSDVGQWANSTHANSQWSLQQYSGNYYRLQNRATGLYLDGMGHTANGSAAGQWANTTHVNAQWEMVLVSGSAISSSSSAKDELKVFESEETNEVKVYPNPATDVLNISLPSESENGAKVQLVDAAGKVVLKSAISGTNLKLNVASISAGFYILIIDDGVKVAKQKVMIE